ncbi:MAG: hypothetical protein O7E54_00995 [Planctomycetota bacterium]|nr:hypothetical protein [Planctomycetota bacterium]
MRDARDYAIAALGAALVFCLGLLAGSGSDVLPEVGAQDPTADTTTVPISPLQRNIGPRAGVSVPRIASDSNSNNRFVAVSAPIATGDSILYVLDSKAEQLLIYRYLLGKGVQVVAARKIDYDLKMSGYKDFSEYSRDELKALFEKQRARSLAKAMKKR